MIEYNQNVKQTIQKRCPMKNRIYVYRKANSISQEELADHVQVTRQTIISLEKGKYTASLSLAHKLANYFGVAIEDLFVFDELKEEK
jgi:putative transcriptional regulator